MGSAHIHAPEVRELKSEGILLDMWNALSFLRSRNPKLMTSLCWYTFEHGFQPEGPPFLIPLPRIQTRVGVAFSLSAVSLTSKSSISSSFNGVVSTTAKSNSGHGVQVGPSRRSRQLVVGRALRVASYEGVAYVCPMPIVRVQSFCSSTRGVNWIGSRARLRCAMRFRSWTSGYRSHEGEHPGVSKRTCSGCTRGASGSGARCPRALGDWSN